MQMLTDPIDISKRMLHITRPGSRILRSYLLAQDRIDSLNQLIQVDPFMAGAVENHSGGRIHLAGQDIGFDHIAHKGEIAGLLAITVNNRRAILQDGLDESGDDR